uniref:Uncharacterized protein n=1 Tax=Ditylenchus dipsaci TaxID=166011 RepID=A0A915CP88_9BILA
MDSKNFVTYSQLLFHQRIFESAEENKNGIALTNAETGENINFTTLRQRSLLLASSLTQEYGTNQIVDEKELLKLSNNLTLDDVILAPLSSGTTGTPKCVLLTHRNLNAATDILKSQLFDELSARHGRRSVIALLPFYHASGFWALCYCLLAGHHSVVMNKFQAPLLLSSIEDYKVFMIFSSALTIVELPGYGMTEVVVLSHLCPLDLPSTDEKHLNSCGKLLPGFECKLVDSETGELVTNCGQQGELWLKSDCVMKGYLDDEEETRLSLDSDGWYHTGDIVYFDEDGFYYVVGRIRNMIKVNGLQVSPIELENLLLAHEDVLESAVIGVPDDNRGEVPKAFVVLKIVDNVEAKVEEIFQFIHDKSKWERKLEFEPGSDSSGPKLVPRPGEPNCYTIGGRVTVFTEFKGDFSIYFELRSSANKKQVPESCSNQRPDGCGGFGSCLYCDACQTLSANKGIKAQLLLNGNPISCGEGLKPGSYDNLELKFACQMLMKF